MARVKSSQIFGCDLLQLTFEKSRFARMEKTMMVVIREARINVAIWPNSGT